LLKIVKMGGFKGKIDEIMCLTQGDKSLFFEFHLWNFDSF